MIVVDTSALMALLLAEPQADQVAAILKAEGHVVISAGTLAEALVVAARRGVAEELTLLIDGIGIQVDSLAVAGAHAVAEAYSAWGKGQHPAGLNFGDCFAYVTAKANSAPLLFVGDDFSKTDVAAAI
ncbi:MAG: type II toxin-antitoxin system VapC family toxin [Boseongicola sp. SB0662_bin_57]|nr:type II toxin-antitoxin system VapC family toxin [Boseongicola sp. SB0662_bin_57]